MDILNVLAIVVGVIGFIIFPTLGVLTGKRKFYIQSLGVVVGLGLVYFSSDIAVILYPVFEGFGELLNTFS
ncbi:hypothetical protein [Pontibacillus halophilus]|uniref:hypothetical protein n=1 Tax=Pontibacillus halophilus TaxID=516704 RepID=UPI0004062CDE|nr:hypothetical protein [Pontibacillus halophilus]